MRLFRPAEALADLARAAALRPDYADAHINAAIALRGLGRYMEALASLERARALRPQDVTAAWTEAVIKLALGEYREGWPLFEARLSLEPARRLRREFEQPRYTGAQSLQAQRLLVYANRDSETRCSSAAT